jgi:glycine betaine catabolism B
MKIKSFFQDVLGSTKVTKRRKDAIKRASSIPDGKDPITDCARSLHPGKIQIQVVGIRDSSLSSKTITFSSFGGHIPLFKAGQYMTLEFDIETSHMTRTYTISSAPYQTRGDHPIVEITVKKKEDGLTSLKLYDEAKVGDVFTAEIGLGQFFYEPLRDSRKLMLLAGGGGVTPFMSMLREIHDGKMDCEATLLYGSTSDKDIVLKDELDAMVCDKIKVIHVISSPSEGYQGEKGYLSCDLIRKYMDRDMTYFVCGPQKMYDFLHKELSSLSIPERRIRYEGYGQPDDISLFDGYPSECKGMTYRICVRRGIREDVIPANADESLAVALERAGMKIHIGCRSGACGFCRIKVEEGSYFVLPINDYRRAADKDFDYVHACSTYPTSDMAIRINIE